MVAGNMHNLAFVVEKLGDCGGCGYTSGSVQMYINGCAFPPQACTATLNSALEKLLCSSSPLIALPCDGQLFCLEASQLFNTLYQQKVSALPCPFSLPLAEIETPGYHTFIVCCGNTAKVVCGTAQNGTTDVCACVQVSVSVIKQIAADLEKLRQSL